MSTQHILQRFHEWFFSPAGPGLSRIPFAAPINTENGLTALTLYRHNGFQAELVLGQTCQPYRITLPQDMEMMISFLSGSLEVSCSSWSGSISPDTPEETFNTTSPSPDFIEQPHPSREGSFLLPTDEDFTINFPQKNGILLVLSKYHTGELHSCLDHISTIEPLKYAA